MRKGSTSKEVLKGKTILAPVPRPATMDNCKIRVALHGSDSHAPAHTYVYIICICIYIYIYNIGC